LSFSIVDGRSTVFTDPYFRRVNPHLSHNRSNRMSKKTVYPYAEARENGSALFRSSKSPKSIYAALHEHGKAHGEKWGFERVAEANDDLPPQYQLVKVS